MSHETFPQIFLARHGQTEWSLSGQHTSRTDLPLTAEGEREAGELKAMLHGRSFARVWSSPRLRAKRTCELVGYGSEMEIVNDLAEWNYGDFEGQTTPDIRKALPGWQIFRDGSPTGETVEQMTRRVDRLIASLRKLAGDTILFSHGHLLRSLGTRWIGQPLEMGMHLALSTASLSILSFDGSRELPIVKVWNATAQVR